MEATITNLFYLKRAKANVHGLVPIYHRTTINGKRLDKSTGKYIDLEDLDRADPNVYNMLSSGHTMGVFQCEQAPYTKLLVQMGVSSFDELAATNALVRPGAAKTIGKEYISRKQGKLPA